MRIQDKFFFTAHRRLNAHSPHKSKKPNLRMHTLTLPSEKECTIYHSTVSAKDVDTEVDGSGIIYHGYKHHEEFIDKIKRIKANAIKFLQTV